MSSQTPSKVVTGSAIGKVEWTPPTCQASQPDTCTSHLIHSTFDEHLGKMPVAEPPRSALTGIPALACQRPSCMFHPERGMLLYSGSAPRVFSTGLKPHDDDEGSVAYTKEHAPNSVVLVSAYGDAWWKLADKAHGTYDVSDDHLAYWSSSHFYAATHTVRDGMPNRS